MTSIGIGFSESALLASQSSLLQLVAKALPLHAHGAQSAAPNLGIVSGAGRFRQVIKAGSRWGERLT
eukprot:6415301-Prorocentrum_lima.AAC.1